MELIIELSGKRMVEDIKITVNNEADETGTDATLLNKSEDLGPRSLERDEAETNGVLERAGDVSGADDAGTDGLGLACGGGDDGTLEVATMADWDTENDTELIINRLEVADAAAAEERWTSREETSAELGGCDVDDAAVDSSDLMDGGSGDVSGDGDAGIDGLGDG
jgi:hypothetical protein